MESSEIKSLMAQGESESLELKKSLRSQNDALKTAAAFANGYVSRNIRTYPIFESGKVKRDDIPEYDLDAVREAVANAVAHRDYRAHEPIQLRLFDDRLEISNPGPLPDDLTIEGILAGGVTRARDPILAQILLASGYMERAGFGIVFIRERMTAGGASEPEFESGQSHFIARLWARPAPDRTEI
ncbi:MAG: ATP-binding protein [bacterium]